MSSSQICIENLNIYPVKSCGGLKLEKMSLGFQGAEASFGGFIVRDREWMFTDKEGNFLTQRQCSRLSLIHPVVKDSSLYLHFENEKIELPQDLASREMATVKVWFSEVQAVQVNSSGLKKIEDFLKIKVKLFHFDQQSHREVQKGGVGLGVQTRFTDSQPYLLVNQESLRDLNSKMKESISMSRFRANIEVSGASAFAEDQWALLKKSDVELTASKPCSRCVMVNIDQDNRGASEVRSNPETLKTLAQYRKREKGVFFGQYFVTKSFRQEVKLKDIFSIGTI